MTLTHTEIILHIGMQTTYYCSYLIFLTRLITNFYSSKTNSYLFCIVDVAMYLGIILKNYEKNQ